MWVTSDFKKLHVYFWAFSSDLELLFPPYLHLSCLEVLEYKKDFWGGAGGHQLIFMAAAFPFVILLFVCPVISFSNLCFCLNNKAGFQELLCWTFRHLCFCPRVIWCGVLAFWQWIKQGERTSSRFKPD